MPNDTGIFSGNGPWWARLIEIVGPTALISIGLVYWLTQSLTPILQNMNVFMQSHTQQAQTLIENEKDDSAQRTRQWEMIGKMQQSQHKDREAALSLEQQTCVNTAKSTYQTQKCLDIRNDGEEITP